MKKIFLVIIFIALMIAIIFAAVRYVRAEDDWICVQGEWVENGCPQLPKPTVGCHLYEE